MWVSILASYVTLNKNKNYDHNDDVDDDKYNRNLTEVELKGCR